MHMDTADDTQGNRAEMRGYIYIYQAATRGERISTGF